MKILVVGATGVLGRQVTPRLRERGHEVRVVVRKTEQADKFRRLGVEAALGDILDAASLRTAVTGCDVALHLATAIPKPGGTQDWALNDRIRREGTRHLLAACQEAGVRRYIQQSTAFLYEDRCSFLHAKRDTAQHLKELSRQELTVLTFLAHGMSNQQISLCLHICPKTVKNHLTHIFAKLRTRNRHQAARQFFIADGVGYQPVQQVLVS